MIIKKSLAFTTAILLAVFAAQANAVTIINHNKHQVHYEVYSYLSFIRCAHGEIGVGQKMQWQTSGSKFWHPFCGGDSGPAHIEITTAGYTGIAVFCTDTQHNIRMGNQGNTLEVTADSAMTVSCHAFSE